MPGRRGCSPEAKAGTVMEISVGDKGRLSCRALRIRERFWRARGRG